MRVRQGGETKLRAAPEDQVLGETGEVGADQGHVEEELGDVVTIGNSIHRVGGDAVEAELIGNLLAIKIDR